MYGICKVPKNKIMNSNVMLQFILSYKIHCVDVAINLVFYNFFLHSYIQQKCYYKVRGGCLLMDRYEMSYLYRGPSIDASYQVSVHLADGF